MKTQLLIGLLAASALFTGCKDDEIIVPEVGPASGPVTLTVGVPEHLTTDDSQSRVDYQDESMNFVWKANDKIALLGYHGANFVGQQELTLTGGENSAKATFEGEFIEGATYYKVCYKPSKMTIGTDGKVTVDYTGQQQTASSSTAHLHDYLYLTSNNISIPELQKGDVDLFLNNGIMRLNVQSVKEDLGKVREIEWAQNYGSDDQRSVTLSFSKEFKTDSTFTAYLCFQADSMFASAGAVNSVIFY